MNPRFLVFDDRDIVDRADGAPVPVDPGTVAVSLLPDGRHVELSADVATVVDGLVRRQVCTSAPSPPRAEGLFVVCSDQEIHHVDRGLLLTAGGSGFWSSVQASPSGRALLVHETRGGAIDPFRRHVSFAEAGLVDVAIAVDEQAGRRPSATWSANEGAVVIGGLSKLMAINSAGRARGVEPPADLTEFALEEDVLFVAGASEVDALDLGTMVVHAISDRGLIADWHMTGGRLVSLGIDGALQIDDALTGPRRLIDEGPFSVLFPPAGRVAIAGVTEGDRPGYHLFEL